MSCVSSTELWNRYLRYYLEFPDPGLALDISRVGFPSDYLDQLQPMWEQACSDMRALEAGTKANPDERDAQGQPGRMVGHYWLRAPELAPQPWAAQIRSAQDQIKQFAQQVHSGQIRGAAGPFRQFLLIGIGGSALGPQFVAHALGHPKSDKLEPLFLDNTDPDGIDRLLARLEGRLGHTLVIVVSKSGETKETSNGMVEMQRAYQQAGLNFAQHAVAVTQPSSRLDQQAAQQGWLARFPIWDWVGGRTSETSAVGLLPAALQGLDIDELLAGARACDRITRAPELARNPAGLLAAMWYYLGEGRGAKDMVVIPYKDRLELLARYLQQLVMESLGKEKDRQGRIVHQGLSVYGNKGSTDQHAYVQQLRDGLANFFVVFIVVRRQRQGPSPEVEPGVTSGDYLHGFWLGTRQALYAKGRQSITITVPEVSARTVGGLIALFERAVGFYASFININAYHQPGVQAGKLAAEAVLHLQKRLANHLAQRRNASTPYQFTAAELAQALGVLDQVETVWHLCRHLAANQRGLKVVAGASPADMRFEAC